MAPSKCKIVLASNGLNYWSLGFYFHFDVFWSSQHWRSSVSFEEESSSGSFAIRSRLSPVMRKNGNPSLYRQKKKKLKKRKKKFEALHLHMYFSLPLLLKSTRLNKRENVHVLIFIYRFKNNFLFPDIQCF